MTQVTKPYLHPTSIEKSAGTPVRLRCPYCRHQGLLEKVTDAYDFRTRRTATDPRVYHSVRRCPNRECHGIVYSATAAGGQVLESHPPEVVDWDATNLPSQVLESFEECVQTFAVRCFRASALMARRTLELVCDDQGASGRNLQDRLVALGTKAVVPAALDTGLDNLRLLGNDAAHVNAKEYEQIGEEEARLALDVTKELLRAVYQYAELVARLDALKKPRD